MSTELWKPIRGWKRYDVSNRGRVRRRCHALVYRDGRTRWYPSLILRPGVTKTGYHVVVLSKRGSHITCNVHRLVADAFLPPRPCGMEVNHKDGNKANQRADNLEWVTHAENAHHSIRTGLRKIFAGFGKRTKNKYVTRTLQAA